MKIISVLRQVVVTKSGGNVQSLLLSWCSREIDVALEAGEKFDPVQVRIVSAALKLFENLVPKAELTEAMRDLLRKATDVKDRRVAANALDTLTYFHRQDDSKWTERLSVHPDNRVAANALVYEGVRSMSPIVKKRLAKMLKAKDPVSRSSALYALGEIAAYHRSSDIVYYSTQVDFHRLVEKLSTFAIDADSRVRKQALIALRKCDDRAVIEELKVMAQDEGLASEIRGDVREFLNQYGFVQDSSRDAA
jgi:HEAT repeat protein